MVPLGNSNKLPTDKTPDDFFNEVRRRRELQSGAEAPYIAAKFGPSELPKRFNVGDKNFKNRYGYYNKELTKGAYYTMFERAYVKNNKGVGRLYVRQSPLGLCVSEKLPTYPSPKPKFCRFGSSCPIILQVGLRGRTRLPPFWFGFWFRRSQKMWCAFDAVSLPFSEKFFQTL